MIKKLFIVLAVLLVLSAAYLYNTFNDYQVEGDLQLAVLDAPVSVKRDQLGIPYINAGSLPDLMRAQGFITAQDRLYQVELYRYLAYGRLSRLFGDRARENDLMVRAINIPELANTQAEMLNDQARSFFLYYLEGLNAYIDTQKHEHPFSLNLVGMNPEPWTLQDIVAVQLFQAWANGGNWRIELQHQQFIDALGIELAQEISQVTVNPENNIVVESLLSGFDSKQALNLTISPELLAAIPNPTSYGSNAWATDNNKSSTGKPILSSNPHLRVTTLPGFWHPMGLFTPQLRAVGAASPGSPGLGIGRTTDVAFGATVGNSDATDLYIETLDPTQKDHYIENGQSLPMNIRDELLHIKDDNSDEGYRTEVLRFRTTPRGVLISDHGMSLDGNRALALRWAIADGLTDSTGLDMLLLAKNIDEVHAALQKTPLALAYITADRHGGIARIAAGRVPIRLEGDGSSPMAVTDGIDNWAGLIPADEMPVLMRPESGWVGTANHRLVDADYPYPYSKNFAVSWRYRRIQEFMTESGALSAEDHWNYVTDLKNPMAEKLIPLYLQVLGSDENTQYLADILADWDFYDRADQVAPALFQTINRQFIRLTFSDQIPQHLWDDWFDNIYAWQERAMLLMEDNNNHWFDDRNTPEVETRDQLLLRAAQAAEAELKEALGPNAIDWQWGKLHTITFASPVIPGKTMARWLGGGTRPMFGSSETLNRALYKHSEGYDTVVIDSLRLVADFADDEKVLAVIPGGTSGRYLDSTLHNQTDAWMENRPHHWWFSEKAVAENAVTELVLVP